LEITETALMSDIEHNLRVLNDLGALGMSLAVDDFGTGYSSLNQLSRLPVKYLKIDRSFIETMEEDKGNHTIVAAVISMAHALSMKVIAEGVETHAQHHALNHLDCDCIQGYLFYKPTAVDTLQRQLDEMNSRSDTLSA
ncbi:MAG: EAL domain-containing protein, partial [Chromatiales bacterium]|nr:EAL domain-containing protein [Chromatiales bacterium]